MTLVIPIWIAVVVIIALPFIVSGIVSRMLGPAGMYDFATPLLVGGSFAVTAAACWTGLICWFMWA